MDEPIYLVSRLTLDDLAEAALDIGRGLQPGTSSLMKGLLYFAASTCFALGVLMVFGVLRAGSSRSGRLGSNCCPSVSI